MISYVVVVKEKSPEKFQAVHFTAIANEAKELARKTAQTSGLVSYVFEIGRAIFRFDDNGNELEA